MLGCWVRYCAPHHDRTPTTMTASKLPRDFYARSTLVVARQLIGMHLVHEVGGVRRVGRIVETEAYLGPHDRAAHSARGLTARTRVMFGPPGHAYVYLIYGLYECLNLVAEPDGEPGCVLLRALEPVAGLDEMRRRRPAARRPEDLASGPGKLTLAMGITRRYHGQDLTRGPLIVRRPDPPPALPIAVTPRIGITHCADWPLRFCIEGNAFVSGSVRTATVSHMR